MWRTPSFFDTLAFGVFFAVLEAAVIVPLACAFRRLVLR